MEKYEMTLVLPAKAKAKEKATKEKIEKLMKAFGGKLVSFDSWGEIELAYEIKKQNSGTFLHFNLELDRDKLSDLNDKLRVDEDLIRHLIVRKEEKK